uniref:RanBP-type and C3HC4-type zinc finger-containing protein 1 n=1 Tax=Ditylum brightwellii TaxID=49249 RepID=A0A6U3T8X9_9STRA|mmetsp:Transcript_35911/g.53515  ORF Transcript_35911/g.53515 Transcript_35911/m.53515 type:complete len:512 (+) Transcript_35911:257-1792(+)
MNDSSTTTTSQDAIRNDETTTSSTSYETLMQQVWEENEISSTTAASVQKVNTAENPEKAIPYKELMQHTDEEHKSSNNKEETFNMNTSSSVSYSSSSPQKNNMKEDNKDAGGITTSSTLQKWSCITCTFINDASNIDGCSICQTVRPLSSFPQPIIPAMMIPVASTKNEKEVEKEKEKEEQQQQSPPPNKKARIDTTIISPNHSSSSITKNIYTHKWKRPKSTNNKTQKSPKIECPICLSDVPTTESVQLSSCTHTFCETCIRQYITDKIQNGQVLSTQLTCPSVDPTPCNVPLDPVLDICPCFSSSSSTSEEEKQKYDELQKHYERLSLQRYIELENDMACCPTPKCTFTFVWDEDNRKLICPLCDNTYCLVCCASPWHFGMTCESYQELHGPPITRLLANATTTEEDKEFVKFAQQAKLRQCPKCQFFVEKKDGCDAMHCRCNFVFCFKCGGVRKQEDMTANNGVAKGVSVCNCPGMASMLQAHEGQMSHNLRVWDGYGDSEDDEGDAR